MPANYTTTDLLASDDDDAIPYKDLIPFASIPVTVANTGNVTSDFVVLAFLKGEYGPQPYPLKSLVGFTRLHDVEPGQVVNATMDVDVGTIARGDENGDLVLWPGTYKVLLDVDGVDEWEFEIGGEEQVLDSWPAR